MSSDNARIYIDVGDHTLAEDAIGKDEYLQKIITDVILKSDYQFALHWLGEHGTQVICIISYWRTWIVFS